MGKAVKFNIKGLENAANAMRSLTLRNQTAVVRKGVSDASSIVVKASKDNIRRVQAIDTTSLHKSMTKRVRTYKQGDLVLGMIGPGKSYYDVSGSKPKKIGRKKGETGASYRSRNKGKKRPSNYAHLVEFGFHSAAATGVSGFAPKGTSRRKKTFPERSFVLPRPFLRPAIENNKPALADQFRATAREAIKLELMKL